MTDQESRLIVQKEGPITHLGFVDKDILDEGNIQKIGDQIAQIIDDSVNPQLLLNFKQVEHLSSAALGALIRINNKIRAKGGQLRLCCINPQIYEVFAITKLNQLFQIHDTVEQAVASFQ